VKKSTVNLDASRGKFLESLFDIVVPIAKIILFNCGNNMFLIIDVPLMTICS